MMKHLFYAALLLLLPYGLVAENAEPGTFTVVIDAGHGGKDSGTRSTTSLEKNIALKIALKLRDALKAKGIRVVLTRSTDVFVPLYERIEKANDVKASLFISLHCNSLPYNKKNRSSIRGVETYVSGFGRLDEQDIAIRENASILLEKDYKKNYNGYDPKDPETIILLSLMKNAYRTKSIQLATLIQKEYRKAGRIDRGVHEKSLAVLARASMPAVLTEIGYLSSPAEERYMNSEAGQEEISNGILNAILAFR
nr:N-acetylmuramoyl-L-alanine amidase [Arcticibacter tournemirensis]